MADPRPTDGYIVPKDRLVYAKEWAYINIGPSATACTVKDDEPYDLMGWMSPAMIRVAKANQPVKGVTAGATAATPIKVAGTETLLSRIPWINDLLASFPAAVIPARPVKQAEIDGIKVLFGVVWSGVLPTALDTVIVIWNRPITVMHAAGIVTTAAVEVVQGTAVQSISVASVTATGRAMSVKLSRPIAIDGSETVSLDFARGAVSTVLPAVEGIRLAAVALNQQLFGADYSDELTADPSALTTPTADLALVDVLLIHNKFTLANIPCVFQYELVDAKRNTKALLCWAANNLLHGHPRIGVSFGYGNGAFNVDPEQITQINWSATSSPITATAVNMEDQYVIFNADAAADAAVTVPLLTSSVPMDVLGTVKEAVSKGAIGQSKKTTDLDKQLGSAPASAGEIQGDVDVPLELGGGGGSVVVSAIVYGGNCVETVAPFATAKTDIYALARFPKPLDPTKPVSWAALELPISFKHGDPIPQRSSPDTPVVTPSQAKWPNGVGIARLCRNAVVGSKAWNADVYEAALLQAVVSAPYYCGFKGDSHTKIYVYFNKPIIACDLTKTYLTENTLNHGRITVTAVAGAGTSTLTLTLSSAVVVTAALGVLFAPNCLTVQRITNSDGTTVDVKNTANVALPITMIDAYSWWMPTPIDAVAGVTIRDAVYDPAAGTGMTLLVYFNGPVSAAPVITLSAPADTITIGNSPTIAGDVVTYTMTSKPTDVQLAGAVTVDSYGGATTVQGDIPSGAIASGSVTLRVKAARNCYVTVINRSTEKAYVVGDIIDVAVSSTYELADQQSTPVVMSCYDTALREALSTGTRTVLQLLYGQDISGLKVIKYAAAVPTELPEFTNVYATSFATDGVGSAYVWTNGIRDIVPKLVFNNNLLYPHLLVTGQIITSTITVRIKITGTDPERFQTFYVPYGF